MNSKQIEEIWITLDTSTSLLSISLWRASQLLDEHRQVADRNHSTYLLPAMEQLLKRNNVPAKEVDGIAVGVGPGSYTGVRIGVTAAKTFAWALGIPVIERSSLDLLAWGSLHAEEKKGTDDYIRWIIPMVDARRNQVYTSILIHSTDLLRSYVKDHVAGLEDWVKKVGQLAEEVRSQEDNPNSNIPNEIVFVGIDGVAKPFVDELIGQYEHLKIAYRSGTIEAAALGELLTVDQSMGEAVNVHQVNPNYAQLAEAEVKLKERTNG